MSHQSGITAGDDLRSYFSQNKDGRVRVMKIGIENEVLVLQDSADASGSWEDDWDHQVLSRLEDKMPCFMLYRLDSKSHYGYEWVFIAYSPDFAHVRQKMLYASTRATLKKEFGGGQIKDELFGTVPHDVNLAGYKKHVVSQHAPKPLTMAEEELEEIKRNEVNADIGVDTKHQTVQGVAFPLSNEAIQRLEDLREQRIAYVQLSLDVEKETINLSHVEDSCDVKGLPRLIPRDAARYHFFNYEHSHEGDQINSIVFIYSIPGYSGSIKERMLYSTCKAPLLNVAEQQLNMDIARKIEIDDPKELTSDFVYSEVHPAKNIAKQQFAKPKGPTGRGPKRMTRPAEEED